MLKSAALVLIGVLLIADVAEACERDPRVGAVAEAWLAHRQPPSLADLDVAAGRCFRIDLMQRLATTLGPVVGYKVGVYTAAARKTYGTSEPVVGELRQQMLLEDGAQVSVRAGVALLAESDFVLVVGDAGINDARTREQAYRHLRGYRPFVELPDLNYAGSVPPSLGQLVALNVGARLGVLGKEVPLPQSEAGFAALSNLKVDVIVGTADATRRSSGVARETLGDPVEIVLAARDVLRRAGTALKAGDLISIGTITPPPPAKAGETFKVRYHVLTQPAEVSVTFTP